MLMIAGVNLAMAQGLSSNDIKASWDFKNGTVAYSIVSADIPAGSTFSWKVDSKNVTDGISNSGQTITLPLTNKTRSGDVTITSADNTSQTVFSASSRKPMAWTTTATISMPTLTSYIPTAPRATALRKSPTSSATTWNWQDWRMK